MALKYRHGQTTMIDYNPGGSAITAGDTVAVGKWFGVAHGDIPANTLGALSIPNGCCVYEADKGTATDVIAAGDLLEVDTSANTVEPSGDLNGNGIAARAVKASANGDATVWVVLIPTEVDYSA